MAHPIGDGEGDQALPDATSDGPDDAEIERVIRAAAGDRLAVTWKSRTTIPRIRKWIDGDLDLEAHIGEAIKAVAGKLTQPLEHPSSDLIYKTACEIRDRARRGIVTIFDPKMRDSFDRFWEVYPHKVDRQKAQVHWAEACRDLNSDVQPIFDGLARYLTAKPTGQAWLKPTTFLKDRRWEDEARGDVGQSPNLASMRRDMISARGKGNHAGST